MNTQLAWFILFFVCIALCTYLFLHTVPEPADVLYVNGRIYTMDGRMNVAEALATRGDRIVAIGSKHDLEGSVRAKQVIDLGGKTVLPGFIDAHAHLMSLGVSKITVDLVGASSEAVVAGLVVQRVQRTEQGQWVRGRGWDQNLWPTKRFPTHEVLDKISPNNPVYLARVDGHAAWINKKGLEIAGITKETPDPAGGKIERDKSGNPTGVFVDNAMSLVSKFLPPPSVKESEEAIKLAVGECLQFGIVCMDDMGVDAKDIEIYKGLIDKKEFPFRVYTAIEGLGETWDQYTKKTESGPAKGRLSGYGDNRLWVRALKLYVDGALGSRGAALLEPYSDDPGNRGLTVTDEKSLRQAVDEALANGFQVCTHAIGDRANKIILAVYEAALKDHPVADHRLRVEHVQVLALEDIPRFKKLGIIPSMQPIHCTSDMYWAEARLGSARILGAYAWRSLLETGVIIPGGSDFPVESPNPILGIYAAVTRQDLAGKPKNSQDIRAFFELSSGGVRDTAAFENGWYASQKMTREESIRAYTSWASYAAFQEHLLGSLEKGKLADFVILSKDIMRIESHEIPTTVVEKTIVGGTVVYARAQETVKRN
ncbi:MAG: amidohydrolase [Ignavibacteriales bacterium]|nr:amidohydrolase [Ignavibacteriales bacterium]